MPAMCVTSSAGGGGAASAVVGCVGGGRWPPVGVGGRRPRVVGGVVARRVADEGGRGRRDGRSMRVVRRATARAGRARELPPQPIATIEMPNTVTMAAPARDRMRAYPTKACDELRRCGALVGTRDCDCGCDRRRRTEVGARRPSDHRRPDDSSTKPVRRRRSDDRTHHHSPAATSVPATAEPRFGGRRLPTSRRRITPAARSDRRSCARCACRTGASTTARTPER